jgi:signal transduction histidine kinase
MRLSLGKKIAGGFGIASLILGVIGVTSYRSTIELLEDAEWRAHTYEVLDSLQIVRRQLTDAETGQRGYLITGKSNYLEPYRLATATLDQEVKSLRRLTSDNANQQRRLDALELLVARKLAELGETIALREDKGFQAAVLVVMTDVGLKAMDDARTVIGEMEGEERLLLRWREKRVRTSANNTIHIIIFGSLLAFGLVASSNFVIHRDLVGRRLVEKELQRAHDELQTRVRERTAELAEVNEGLRTVITQRQRAEAELSRFAAQLELSNRELQDFASVASHDLQEPLRKIQAFGDRLKAKQGPALTDEGRDYLERMQHAAGRMQTLINDLLTLSRVTTKAQPFVPVDLAEVTREVLSDLEVRIEQGGGRVEVGDLPTIDADPVQIGQLLQNLIGNALKFHRAEEAPVVKIQGRLLDDQGRRPDENPPPHGRCQITVEDNGIGFDEKYLDRIFTVFQRLHGRSEYEGTGVGLAVCRKIAERHGGSITARSTPGRGATFAVMLPVINHKGESPC